MILILLLTLAPTTSYADESTTISNTYNLSCTKRVQENPIVVNTKTNLALDPTNLTKSLNRILISRKQQLKEYSDQLKKKKSAAVTKSLKRRIRSMQVQIKDTTQVIKSINACIASAPLTLQTPIPTATPTLIPTPGPTPVTTPTPQPTATPIPTPTPRVAECGNGIIEDSETCDDGNTLDGDCCSHRCTLEPVGTSCDDPVSIPGFCAQRSCNAQGACVRAHDNLSCSDGNTCTTGERCIAGSCSGGNGASTEKSCGVGACKRTVTQCTGKPAVACVAGKATAELCNGIDDNCNGKIDDGLTAKVSCGVGVCKVTIPQCANGAPAVCQPNPAKATKEICNKLDDDCDGIVDNEPDVRKVLTTLPHVDSVKSSCTAGAYKIICAANYANVDNKWQNGCEVNLREDMNNCGAVGRKCATGECIASSSCVSGQCRTFARAAGGMCGLITSPYCINLNGKSYAVDHGFGSCDGAGGCAHNYTYCQFGCGVTGRCNSF